MTTQRWEQFRVSGDWRPERIYDAWTRRETWNGAECPYFTLAVVKELALDVSEFAATLGDEPDVDLITIDESPWIPLVQIQTVSAGAVVQTEDVLPTRGPDGQLLYGVGAFAWTWYDADYEKPNAIAWASDR